MHFPFGGCAGNFDSQVRDSGVWATDEKGLTRRPKLKCNVQLFRVSVGLFASGLISGGFGLHPTGASWHYEKTFANLRRGSQTTRRAINVTRTDIRRSEELAPPLINDFPSTQTQPIITTCQIRYHVGSS